MKLFSAFEDFVRTTLGSVPGELRRLRFVASMRHEGKYEHWGLARTYGEDAAQKAINNAHADAFERALVTPIPRLFQEEVAQRSPGTDILPGDMPLQTLLPADLRGGTPRHLGWIIRVVRALKESR